MQSICDLLNLIRSEINVLLHSVTNVLFRNLSKLIILLRKLSKANGFVRIGLETNGLFRKRSVKNVLLRYHSETNNLSRNRSEIYFLFKNHSETNGLLRKSFRYKSFVKKSFRE